MTDAPDQTDARSSLFRHVRKRLARHCVTVAWPGPWVFAIHRCPSCAFRINAGHVGFVVQRETRRRVMFNVGRSFGG